MESLDSDHALAVLLQTRFDEETKKEGTNNKENLPVKVHKPSPRLSITDPEWETTDPCPDIHGLFISFNDRFFWGRLVGVEVKWSQQMTSCAGICVYEGRNGLCSVRLSAPLLKLRPRSDLVETLLHEMIHAYLFVTDNNKDRNGHGAEFHKHMYRINREAGTNITVYHSFHAEVQVYKQHWWRCNGPCHNRAPFFGMVKRAHNRIPSPNDIWWADHQATCGGMFVKVREPENYKNKKQKKDKQVVTDKDIRQFFKDRLTATATSTSEQIGKNIFGFINLSNRQSPSTRKRPSSGRMDLVNRITGFKDLNTLGTSNGDVKSGGIQGKGHVLGRSSSGSVSGRGMVTGRGGMLANKGGGTLVVTGKKKPVEESQSPNTKLRVDTFKIFSGSGFTLGGTSSAPDRSRSRLLNIDHEPDNKKQKFDDFVPAETDDFDHMCRCSVCNKSMPRGEVDEHLESCSGLKNVFNNTLCVDETEISSLNKKYKITCCPICSVSVEGDINNHIDECLNTSGVINVFDEPPIEISDDESQANTSGTDTAKTNVGGDIEIIESEDRVACPICGMRFGKSKINDHVNQCLDSE